MKKEETINLAKDEVSTLFKKLFFPTLLGMLGVSAVTTIDGIFVGHGVGGDGIAAVNIAIPLLMILTGVALMLGIGSSVIASVNLSHGRKILARVNVTQAMLVGTIAGAVPMVAILIFPEKTAYLLGSSESLLPLVTEYLVWSCPTFMFQAWVTIAMLAIRLDGAPKFAMWCSLASSLINAVLDYLFIFPFGWGIMGAAFASSISCGIGAVMALGYIMFYARTMRLHPLRFGARKALLFARSIASQCKIGSAALLSEATMAILMLVGNLVFMHFLGDKGVGAFGISCYYLPFVFMIGNSIAQSAQPIISYNFGLGQSRRVRDALKVAITTAVACGAVSTAAFMLFPRQLVGLFLNTSDEVARIAIDGFPVYGLGFIFFILNITIIGYFQSVEKALPATVFALLRGVVFLLPCFVLLPVAAGTVGIWLAMPVSEILTSSAIAINFLIRSRHSKR